ncbi:MAG: PaaI family thioesterase, partial [Actinobacteria bacterium]|nr:PaaI family thioesterase [Actinomycetota bacterium]
MALDTAFEQEIRNRISSSPFVEWMGIQLTALDVGTCELRLDLEEHHLNPGGIAHGGIIASLLDACIGLALRTKIGTASHVTMQLDIHYVSPGLRGTLVARGTAVHSGRRASYGEARVFGEGDRLVATGSATFLVLDRPH